jgi:hypothetical protein
MATWMLQMSLKRPLPRQTLSSVSTLGVVKTSHFVTHHLPDTADSSDNMPAAKAISTGLAAGHTADKPGYWIHTSGTSILTWYDVANKRWGEEPLAEQKYHDVDGIERLVTLPDDADHRVVDKVVLGSNSDAVKTAIVCPPTIYDTGSGPVNTRSMQVPNMVKGTLEKGFAPVAGVGGTEWDHVHIDDLGDLFVRLADATQDASKSKDAEVFGPRAYYLAENGSHRWADVAKWIAEEAHRQGYLPAALTKVASQKEVAFIDGAATPSYGLNSKGVAARARKVLGWEPKGRPLKDHIAGLVQEDAKALGLTPQEK